LYKMATKKGYRAIVIGATGAVGSNVVRHLLSAPLCLGVTTFSRRSTDIFNKHPHISKLNQISLDFEELCKENKSEEEIECLLFRAIISAQKQSQLSKSENQNSPKIPLYCLMWPEMLPIETLEKVVQLFHSMLLNDKALQKLKNIPYLFTVISTNLPNILSQLLMPFRVTPLVGTSNQLLQQLYCDSLETFTKQENICMKPFAQLYVSKEVGLGKSFKIGRDIDLIQQTKKKCAKSMCDFQQQRHGLEMYDGKLLEISSMYKR